MKRAIIFAGLFLCCLYPATLLSKDKKTSDNAQELAADEAQLVVSADGPTKEAATKSALRSAIEQVCGVFVSSGTEILNDEIVKDEVVTISSGNIREYKELACETLSNGNVSVTLQAVVNVSKIISYVQNKGVTTEFAGATFAMNMQMYELNKRNEEIAMQNLFKQVKALYADAISYSLEVSTPRLTDNQNAFELGFKVIVEQNKEALDAIYKLIQSTLYSLALSKQEYDNYKGMGLPLEYISIGRVLPKESLVFDQQQMKGLLWPKYLEGKATFKTNGLEYKSFGLAFRTDIEKACDSFSEELFFVLHNFEVISNVGTQWAGDSGLHKVGGYGKYEGDWRLHESDRQYGLICLFDVEQPYFTRTITIPKDEIGKYASFDVRKRDANNNDVQKSIRRRSPEEDFFNAG